MKTVTLALTGAVFLALAALNPAHADVDAKQAAALMKSNKCVSCHHESRTKSGPSLQAMAEKHAEHADAVDQLITFMTSGPMVENEEGEEEEHKIIKTKDQAQLQNLAKWILSHGG
jgi:cytochrome c